MNWHDLLAMGNYGLYVWSAYGITLGVFGWNVVLALREQRMVRRLYRDHQLDAPQP
jgi:heme exporter protein CcmD